MLERNMLINNVDGYKGLLAFTAKAGEKNSPVLFIEHKNLRLKLLDHLPQAVAQNVAA